MNKKIKASILIASYNNAKYLKRCLDSALQQTYSNKEIIVLDDDSSDSSYEILKTYKKKITLIKKKKKSYIGSYDQLQSYINCFKVSKGDIIFFLDSDDYFAKKKISTVIKEYVRKKNSKIIYDLPIFTYQNIKKKIKFKENFSKNYWSNIIPTSCISIQREELKKIFKKINFKLFPDIWLDLRLNIFAEHITKRKTYLREYLTFYRQTSSGESYKFRHLSKNWWNRRSQAHDYINFFFKKNNITYKKNLDYYLTKLINFFI